MKKFAILCLFLLAAMSGAFAQKAFGAPQRILLAYELVDKGIDPWRAYFRDEYSSPDYVLEEIEASKLSAMKPSDYDFIIVYGAVMAFTSKEPIRDWLNTNPKLAQKNVGLFVTANRWFLKKYNDQLLSLLKKSGATVVDAVSAETKKLSDKEKQQLVHTFAQKVKRY
ncbi:MAG: hypothetical protein WC784_04890 [Candidatus Shapirobacteria bacterium]|jgi:hypothetical protein